MKRAKIRDIRTLTKQRIYFRADITGLEHGDYAELEKPQYYKEPRINLSFSDRYIHTFKMEDAEIIARSILALIKEYNLTFKEIKDD